MVRSQPGTVHVAGPSRTPATTTGTASVGRRWPIITSRRSTDACTSPGYLPRPPPLPLPDREAVLLSCWQCPGEGVGRGSQRKHAGNTASPEPGSLEQGDPFHSTRGFNKCLDSTKRGNRGPWLKRYEDVLRHPMGGEGKGSLNAAVDIWMHKHPDVVNRDHGEAAVIKDHPRAFYWIVSFEPRI